MEQRVTKHIVLTPQLAAIVEQFMAEQQLDPNQGFSPAIRKIIADWHAQRQAAAPTPAAHPTSPTA